jgi:hypothetical protein
MFLHSLKTGINYGGNCQNIGYFMEVIVKIMEVIVKIMEVIVRG